MTPATVSLAVRYRPRTFAEMVGQTATKLVLGRMVDTDRVPPALLFAGVRGTGKTTAGRILAAALNCEAPGGPAGRPCSFCPSCLAVADGTSPDVLELDAASNGLVADIRTLREALLFATGGRTRVVLLDEAHAMSREAFAALLKTLEEPPPATVFVLLTTEPGKVIDTIISRCMPFEFRKVSAAEIVERLRVVCAKEGLQADDDLLVELAERADGGVRDALMTLDQLSRVGIHTVRHYRKLLGESDFGPGLIRALVRGEHAAAFATVDRQLSRVGDPAAIASAAVAVLRDVLIVHSGGALACGGEAAEERAAVAALVPAVAAVAGCRVLWDLRTRTRAADDPRANLELALVVLAEALAGERDRSAAPAAARPLTVAEMAELARS